jgi:hypothetical protein
MRRHKKDPQNIEIKIWKIALQRYIQTLFPKMFFCMYAFWTIDWTIYGAHHHFKKIDE